MQLYQPIIEKIKKSNYKFEERNLSDILLEIFIEELLTENDKLLFKIAFSQNPTQKELDEFLRKYDIEVAGGNKALMLSYFMKLYPQLKFTNYEEPRLKGLLNYFKFKNLKTISQFSKIGKALNAANIPFMILKGGVMKYLRPELSRNMGDIDILLKNWEDYAKAGEIAKSLGYEFYEPNIVASNSIDLHEKGSEEGVVDIHRYMDLDSDKSAKKLNKDMFARAELKNVFQTQAYIPCPEDILFLALVNMSKNLRRKTSCAGILYNLFDVKYLLETKNNFDWKIVIENAKKSKTKIQLDFAIKFINRIVPKLLPNELQKCLFKKDMQNYCKLVLFDRFVYPDIHERARNMHIKDYIKGISSFKDYLKFKLIYLFFKHIKKHPILFINFYSREMRKIEALWN